MVNRILPGAVALALTLTLVGCPGGKDPKPDSGELSLAGYCAAFPGLMSILASCLHADPAVWDDSVEACDTIEAEVRAGRLAYRGDRARACVDAWTARASSCDLETALPECGAQFSGTVANGGVCLDDIECVEGHCRVEASCPGVCTAYLGLGGDCSAAGARCGPDLYCSSGRCVAVPATPTAKQGEACVTSGCASGLYCDPGTKTCAPRKKSGSCAGAPGACASGYACVESGACVVYAGRGERCGVDATCGEGWACVDGTCAPAPAVGSPCAVGPGTATDCTAAAYCDTSTTPSTCRARKPAGVACTSSIECESYACTAGRCELACIQ